MRPVGLQSCSGGISGGTVDDAVWCIDPDPFSRNGAEEDGWLCVRRLPCIEVGMRTGGKRGGWWDGNDAETLLGVRFEELSMEEWILKEFVTLCVEDVGVLGLCADTLIVGWYGLFAGA